MGTHSVGQHSHLHLPVQPHGHSAHMWAGSSARGHASVAVFLPPTGYVGVHGASLLLPHGHGGSTGHLIFSSMDKEGPSGHAGSMENHSSSHRTWRVHGESLLLPMDMDGLWGISLPPPQTWRVPVDMGGLWGISPPPDGHGRSMGHLSSSQWTRWVHRSSLLLQLDTGSPRGGQRRGVHPHPQRSLRPHWATPQPGPSHTAALFGRQLVDGVVTVVGIQEGDIIIIGERPAAGPRAHLLLPDLLPAAHALQ